MRDAHRFTPDCVRHDAERHGRRQIPWKFVLALLLAALAAACALIHPTARDFNPPPGSAGPGHIAYAPLDKPVIEVADPIPAQVADTAVGYLQLAIKWPPRREGMYAAQAIPVAANSVNVRVTQASGSILADQIVARDPASLPATVSIPLKAETGLLLRVRAFAAASPSLSADTVLAEATASVDLVRSRVTSAKVNLRVKLLGYVNTFFGVKTDIENGASSSARFMGPWGIVRDATGTMYVADNRYIRKIDTAGNVTTLAGSGARDSLDGTGSGAKFVGAQGMAMDASQSILYVGDSNCIRKVTATTGVVTTLGCFDADVIAGVAVAADGTVYATARSRRKVYQITSTGTASVLAGTGEYGATDGIGSSAKFLQPTGIVIEASGSLLIGDTEGPIRRIVVGTPATVSTAVSNVSASSLGLAPDGKIWSGWASGYAARMHRTTLSGPSSQEIYNHHHGFGDGPPGSEGFTGDPKGFTFDAAGNVYFTDQTRGVVRKFDPSANVFSAITGGVFRNGTGTATRFGNPQGLAVDQSGNVYVADTSNNMVRKITPSRQVTTVAGTGRGPRETANDGQAATAVLIEPNYVRFDGQGNLIAFEWGNSEVNRYRSITPAGLISTLMKLPANGADGPIASAGLSQYGGIFAIASDGTIYIADFYRIRKVKDGQVSTLAGVSNQNGCTDGTGANARFRGIYDITMGPDGNIYIADSQSDCNKVRRITPQGEVTSFAGAGQSGDSLGTFIATTFNEPRSLAFDDAGNLYVGDANGIKKLPAGGSVSERLCGGGSGPEIDGFGVSAICGGPSKMVFDPYSGRLYFTYKNSVRVVE
jgi:streptogramin lyase